MQAGTDDKWTWWKHGVVYQVYPRSFNDSDGDGMGDIAGILEKLDYLSDLGIDAVWLSPINTSPMHDFGYDICDYRGIDPVFGTLDDFDRLMAEAHRARHPRHHGPGAQPHLRPASLVHRIALVAGQPQTRLVHLARRGDRRRASQQLALGLSAGAPGNGTSATGQYYLHSFLKEQPDLNWRNPGVKEAMFGEVRFWLDRGVDGFRLDVVNWFIKDDRFREQSLVQSTR